MQSRGIKKTLDYSLIALSFLMVAYQLFYSINPILEVNLHRIIHLGFAMIIVLVIGLRTSKKTWPFRLFLLLAAIASTVYFILAYDMLSYSPIRLPQPALVFGLVTLAIVLILTWQEYGKTFPILAILAVGYMFFGHYVPGLLASPEVSLRRILSWVGGDVSTEWGVYGSMVGISALYLFLFIVFGSVLHAFGGLRFIQGIGQLAARRMRSGPAALSVITSALVGTVTGSTVANITIVGSFTIPMMKKAGYTPDSAGAIESAASNGGQIMPPVMGAVAFVMAGYTGIRYIEICKAALVPALLYFGILLLYAELQARKLGIVKSAPFKVSARGLLLDAPVFIIPLGMLTFLLIRGYSLMFTIFWALVGTVILGLLSALRKEIKLDWADIKDKIMGGVKAGCQIALASATIGVFTTGLELTGLGIALGDALLALAHNNLALLLIMTFFASMFLGSGLPTIATYILTATILSPALVKIGVPLIIAHLFNFIYAVAANLTPPIAIGPMVAAKMAGGDYWKTSWESCKAAVVTFVVPFFFVYAPSIVLVTKGLDLMTIVMQYSAVTLALIAIQLLASYYLFTSLRLYESIALGGAIVLFAVFIFSEQNYAHFFLVLLGVLLLAGVGVVNMLRYRGAQRVVLGATSPNR